MKLIGMLDSPYVRRVAISLQLLELDFEHQSLSVFRNYAEFQRINPVVKAPTLICDDGCIMMDSSLILQYAEALARPRTLLPTALPDLQRELRLLGLALAATEKSVQIVYERVLRPPDKRHEPWASRIAAQLLAAYAELEAELATVPLGYSRSELGQAAIAIGVAWQFTIQMIPDLIAQADFPHLAAFSQQLEALPEFAAAPNGDGTYARGAVN